MKAVAQSVITLMALGTAIALWQLHSPGLVPGDTSIAPLIATLIEGEDCCHKDGLEAPLPTIAPKNATPPSGSCRKHLIVGLSEQVGVRSFGLCGDSIGPCLYADFGHTRPQRMHIRFKEVNGGLCFSGLTGLEGIIQAMEAGLQDADGLP